VLDVVFREDQSSTCCSEAARAFLILRRIALNLLKTESAKTEGPICGKRVFATLDPAFLDSIMSLHQI
jgi:hypothetical protein